ncbi:FABR074Cp [Eremothecium gossypii FDAG1]|nr:FABR074Cp [Eremothecium gossypii FDAG1]
MNQQSTGSLSAQYTLPGVMHYLQTEFTKNERDRINWELERCEMKARIAQLEGENRDLRRELVRCAQGHERPEEVQPVEPSLLKAKLSVQENVKEIVYLLKSPQVTDQLDAWNEKGSSVHLLETMNLHVKKAAHGAPLTPGGTSPTSAELELGQPVAAGLPGSRGYESDQDTVILEEPPVRVPPSSKQRGLAAPPLTPRDTPSMSLEGATGPLSNTSVIQPVAGDSAPVAVEKLTLHQKNLLTLTETGHLKHWQINLNLELTDSLTQVSFEGLGPHVLGLFWWDSKTFMTLDTNGLKVWSVELPEPVMLWECFQDLPFETVDMVDFKNKWLVLKVAEKILIWKICTTGEQHTLQMSNDYEIWLHNQDPTFFILGLTEESLLVLYLDPCQLAVYNFQGKILQQVDLSHLVKDLKPRGKNTTRLVLNKKTSKLLVQVNKQILIYSFDQKKIVASFELGNAPSHIIFKFNSESIILGYLDGTIEVRNLNNFETAVKRYNHFESVQSAHEQPQQSGFQKSPNTDAQIDALLDRNLTSMDIAVIDGVPVVVSGGTDGYIRLESVWAISY